MEHWRAGGGRELGISVCVCMCPRAPLTLIESLLWLKLPPDNVPLCLLTPSSFQDALAIILDHFWALITLLTPLSLQS